MKEYMLIFRADYQALAHVSQKETDSRMAAWEQWVADIVAGGGLAGGNHLATDGRVVHTGGLVTDGPYTELKESVLGLLIVRADSYDGALVMAKKCPILNGEGNTVEVREISGM